MDSTQLTYWLQGFADLNPACPTSDQWEAIKKHLAGVFAPKSIPSGLMPSIVTVCKPSKKRESITAGFRYE